MYNKHKPKIGDIVCKNTTELTLNGKPINCGKIIAVDPRGPVKVRWTNGDESETSCHFLEDYNDYLARFDAHVAHLNFILSEAKVLCLKASS